MDAGVLIVASQRELRRNLFDVAERAGYKHIHTARGLSHAAILLDGRPPVAWVLMAFTGDATEARQACDALRRIPACAEASLLAVLDESTLLTPAQLPEGVSDWLYARQIETELVARLRQSPPTPAQTTTATASDDYRFAFEHGDGAWLIVDPPADCVIEASPAMARHVGMEPGSLRGMPLRELLDFDGADPGAWLERADQAWHPCVRLGTQGAEAGQVQARRIRHAGREAVALRFRSDRADLNPRAALALLARVHAAGGGADMQKMVARMLLDELELDYLALWSAPPEERGSVPTLLVQLWRGDAQPAPELARDGVLGWVLGGRELLCADDAQRLPTAEPLPRELGLAGFIALPLFDERRTVLGALLVGRRTPLSGMEIIEPLLRCAAACFAHSLELRRTREQGRAEGLVDALTGLPNRLLFNDRLDTIIREARRTGECFALLFVDLDNFKSINDGHGHVVGDQVLQAVSQRLTGSVRASDTVARYAGDEFIVVLRHIVKPEDVPRIAEKIVQAVAAPLEVGESLRLQVTTSIGISCYPDDATDADTLLKHADEAMYAAKHDGRNSFQVYELAPEQSLRHDAVLREGLRHAIRNGELQVVYQPQVDAASEDIVGMEALLRWNHPELGPVSPGVFIPVAEQSGLIVSIGEWTLRTACLQAQAWESRFGLQLRLGVNLSAVQLMESDLPEMVATVLRDTRLDAKLLEFEVTESISIKSSPHVAENLHELHRIGCRIAIDDFGTGAASLDYLRKLPADRIKIDQSFVRNIGIDPDDEAIVRATIEMAHRLKRDVIAEGVEIEAHLAFLREHGCDELQGYLFSRPLSQTGFESLLAERRRLLSGTSALSAEAAGPMLAV
jgi:diguanylate cyclase (GGDEF)-like protein